MSTVESSVATQPKVIKIRRIVRPGFFGIDSYARSTTVIGAELSKNGHNTGLTPDDEKYFESKLNLKPGDLNPHSSWWDTVFNVEHVIRLKNAKVNELPLNTPINELKYKVLLASSKVANSEIEKSPNCDFYIDDEQAKAKKELEAFNFEFEGMKLIFTMTPEDKRNSLRLFGKRGVETLSENVVAMYLVKELKDNPKSFFEIMTDKDLSTKALIKELEEYQIIDRKNNTYNYGDDTLGITIEETVNYFNNLANQSVVLTLKNKLAKAKKDKK